MVDVYENSAEDPFHQEVNFLVRMAAPITAGQLNSTVRALGMRLYYDVYAMPRADRPESWQSETYLNLDTYLEGERSDAQDGADSLVASYPLATLEASYIPKFATLLARLASAVNGRIEHHGDIVDEPGVIEILHRHTSQLMESWGEEPGSKAIRILIESNH